MTERHKPRRSGSKAASAGPKAAETGAKPRTKVFISYRRDDTRDVAEFLERSLSERLGVGSVFRDVVTIQPGEPFPQVIERAIVESSCLIALIGRGWLTATDKIGKRRLDSPDDPVRREIEHALQQNVPVVPVLVDGVRMPTRRELPKSIAALAERNALALPWQESVAKLSATIEELERQRELAQYDG